MDYTSLVEALSVVLAAVAIGRAVAFNNYGIIIILAVYASAYIFVFHTTISHSGKEITIPVMAP
jgi:hypothetical protein